ncbi:MAG: tRNA pseudouridine(55) synthase TruB [Candidatus Dormibacteraceae bacterium]
MLPGVLNLDKPAGITSFAVIRRMRALTGVKRVGHAGTLDPLATGVLPVLFGSATRLAEFALRLPKTYVGDVRLGATTVTDDAEAERVPVADPSHLDRGAVSAELAKFVGRIMQEPPAYSAVKLEGERSYRLARRGDPRRPAPREVEILEAELISFRPGPEAVAEIRVVCGSGTYLRSLARDLGRRLGVGGHLGQLVRTAYGGLRIEDSVALADLAGGADVEDRLLSPDVLVPEMERVRLTVEQIALVRQGRPVRVVPDPGPGPLRAHDETGRLIALGHADPLRRTFVPEKVLD